MPSHVITVDVNMDVWSGYDAQPEEPWTTGVACTSFDFEDERVQVLDGSENILGVATFPAEGTWTKSDPENTAPMYQRDGTCTWSATIDELTESNVYVVEMEGWDSTTYGVEELEADDWTGTINLCDGGVTCA